jgi:3-isopropylmalate/(R)-2-methylmalate dehydratase small subunit
VVSAGGIEQAMKRVELAPQAPVTLNVQEKQLTLGDLSLPFEMGDGVRQQFLDGRWDTTAELLANKTQIVATAKKLPYLAEWS